jgi:DNA end-binding protein Ku
MRSIWKGSLSFGLVNIPVKLYPASEEGEIRFKYLHKPDRSPIRYARVCRADGREVPYEDIVRGYEYQEGEFVVIDESDFAKADERKTKTIEIQSFAKDSELDPVFCEKPYYLEPEKGAQKAYTLLREALRRSSKVAIAKFVLRTSEHLCAIRPSGDVLLLEQMRFADEIRPKEAVKAPKAVDIRKEELELALELVA